MCRSFILLVVLLLCGNCSPGLAPALRLDGFVQDRESAVPPFQTTIPITVGDVFDARVVAYVGKYGDEEVSPATEVQAAVSERVRTRLQEAGVKLADHADTTLAIELHRWMVVVDPGFPAADTKAEAELRVEVKRSGQTLYKGTYNGEMNEKNPFMSQPRIEASLGQALDYAIDELLRDRRLQDVMK